MAQWHLDGLREALSTKGWRVVAELPGDGYRISATWQLARGNDDRVVFIDFEGLDDMRTLPIHESYACRVRGTLNALAFGRRGTREAPSAWQPTLLDFVTALEPAPP